MVKAGEVIVNLQTRLMPGAADLLRAHERAMPQKDELCGAFWASLAVGLLTGREVTQEEAALAAGTILSVLPDPHSLPPGQAGRSDYTLELPRTSDSSLSGTSALGVVRSLATLSGGSVAGLPVSGPWTEDSVAALVAVALAQEPSALVLNVATAFLWGSRPPWPDVLGYLAGDTIVGPAPDWDVGHFVAVVGLVQGPGAGPEPGPRPGPGPGPGPGPTSGRSLVLCADTYPSLGIAGVHAQPAACVAAALERPGVPDSGGAILVVPAARAAAAERSVTDLGLALRVWDNGVPVSTDATW